MSNSLPQDEAEDDGRADGHLLILSLSLSLSLTHLPPFSLPWANVRFMSVGRRSVARGKRKKYGLTSVPPLLYRKKCDKSGEGTLLISRKIVRGVDSERPRSIRSERKVFKEEETHQSSGCYCRFRFPSYMREGKDSFFLLF